MEIVSENVLDASFVKVEQFVEDAISRLAEYGGKMVNEIKNEYMPLFGDMVKNFTGEIKGIALGKEVDMLDMPTLVAFAKKYKVSDSNEIVAMKVKQQDGYFIYLTYSRDRQLLPIADNKYIIIKAQSLVKEVEDLFTESELIILK